ncbi:MAG: hypothetical protein EZS28_055010, partial [Streblomastix strix]
FTLAIQQTLVSVRAQQAFTSAASAINNSEIIELMNSAVKYQERMILRDVVYEKDKQKIFYLQLHQKKFQYILPITPINEIAI